ncbi:OmpW/AlkL family protein [Methylobacterium sp. M6A4_1b]
MSALTLRPIPILVGLLALVPPARPASAAEPPAPGDVAGLRAGDWLVRGRVSGSIPTERHSQIGLIGGRVDTPVAILPDADLSYFLTDHIAVEVQGGASRTRPSIRGTLVGDIKVGSIWNAAAMGMVQLHILPGARLNPYLGVGLAASTPLAILPAKGIPNFRLKSQVSPVLQAGFDYHLSGRWFANAMVKYVFVPRQSYGLGGVGVEVDLNMLIVGAGLGYRF